MKTSKTILTILIITLFTLSTGCASEKNMTGKQYSEKQQKEMMFKGYKKR